MKFRTRLALVFCATVLIILGVTGALVIHSFVDRVTREFGNKLSAIAATAALAIDREAHARLVASGREGDDDYNRIRGLLFEIKQINQGQGVYDIYTMTQTKDPNSWIFVVEVDASASSAGFREKYDVTPYPVMRKALNAPVAESKISQDRFGYWLSAFAPVYDRSGKAVAVVGVDASAESIHQLRNNVIVSVLLLMSLGMLLAFPISWVVSGIVEDPVRALVKATEEVGRGNLEYRAEIPATSEFKLLATSFNTMVAGLKERDFLKHTLSRYVSREVMDKIVGTPPEEIMKGERRNVTVLFTDLRQFTTVAETMRAEEVLAVLNQHFSLLIDVLFEYEGTLDKFTGDGLMAMFGTPVMHGDDPERAVRAALAMQAGMRAFNAARAVDGLPPLQIGIGINTGMAVAGGVGSNRRMEYTVIGDTVNAAARIQGVAEGGQVVITQATYEYVKDVVTVTPKGPIELKGKREPVNLFVVEGVK